MESPSLNGLEPVGIIRLCRSRFRRDRHIEYNNQYLDLVEHVVYPGNWRQVASQLCMAEGKISEIHAVGGMMLSQDIRRKGSVVELGEEFKPLAGRHANEVESGVEVSEENLVLPASTTLIDDSMISHPAGIS